MAPSPRRPEIPLEPKMVVFTWDRNDRVLSPFARTVKTWSHQRLTHRRAGLKRSVTCRMRGCDTLTCGGWRFASNTPYKVTRATRSARYQTRKQCAIHHLDSPNKRGSQRAQVTRTNHSGNIFVLMPAGSGLRARRCPRRTRPGPNLATAWNNSPAGRT